MNLQRSIFGLAVCALAAGSAPASTYQIDGYLEANEGIFGGPITIRYDATGLPVADPNNISTTISNVSATATLQSYVSDEIVTVSGTGGSGSITLDDYAFEPDSLFNLTFDVPSFHADLFIPLDFTGNGTLLGDDGLVSADVLIFGTDAGGRYYFGGSSAEVATPEPGSISLVLLGLSSSGGAWVGMSRRRLLGRFGGARRPS